jgi:hypothetical protein
MATKDGSTALHIALILSLSQTTPAAGAMPPDSGRRVIERLDSIRKNFVHVVGSVPQSSSGNAPQELAQWYNWGNWPNWVNWGNWGNWWRNY